MNPNALASELLDATDSIITIIEQENSLLKEARVDAIEPLIEAKKSLVEVYEHRLHDAAQNKAFLNDVDRDLRKKLHESNLRFQDAVRSNVHALRAAMTVNHQVVETIAHSCGVAEPRLLQRKHCRQVMQDGTSIPLDELYAKRATML